MNKEEYRKHLITGNQQQRLNNLNAAYIATDEGDISLEDYSATSSNGKVKVFFKNLEEHLIHYIQESDVVIGCVAWLTSQNILNALAQKKGVSIVVQKEDFLRPDLNPKDNWSKWLNELYDKLPLGPDRYSYQGTVVSSLSVAIDPTIYPVRCVGNYNSQKSSSFPRSHHKFVVFCQLEEAEDEYTHPKVTPYAVWTGSFNFSKTASASFENSLVLTDTEIVKAYYQEWGQIFALSEPLDWESEWVAAEYRIGT